MLEYLNQFSFIMDTNRLVDIVTDLIDDDEISIDDASFNYVETPFFDSLFILSMIAVVDDEYEIVLTGQEIQDAATISKLASLIEAKTN